MSLIVIARNLNERDASGQTVYSVEVSVNRTKPYIFNGLVWHYREQGAGALLRRIGDAIDAVRGSSDAA